MARSTSQPDRSLATQSYIWTRQTQKRFDFAMWPCGNGAASWSLHKIGHSHQDQDSCRDRRSPLGSVLRRCFIRPHSVTRSLRSALDLVVVKPGAHPAVGERPCCSVTRSCPVPCNARSTCDLCTKSKAPKKRATVWQVCGSEAFRREGCNRKDLARAAGRFVCLPPL